MLITAFVLEVYMDAPSLISGTCMMVRAKDNHWKIKDQSNKLYL